MLKVPELRKVAVEMHSGLLDDLQIIVDHDRL